eukprot:SAG31_NODE_14289_length_816_cov_1.126918_1_plen_74_part_00
MNQTKRVDTRTARWLSKADGVVRSWTARHNIIIRTAHRNMKVGRLATRNTHGLVLKVCMAGASFKVLPSTQIP